MANSNNSIEYIQTTSGLTKIYYPTLDQVPSSDTTLTESGKFADAAAVGQRIGKIEETLKDKKTGEITTNNVVDKITSIENKISDVNGHGKSISDLQNILAANGINSNTHVSTDISGMKSDISALENAVGQSAMNLTNWNTATETGWYYNADSTKVGNAPMSKSGCLTFGEVIKQRYQVAYLVSSDELYRCERYYYGSGWKAWIETTPMTKAISEDEFKTMITSINNNQIFESDN